MDQLPDEAKVTRKFTFGNTELTEAPALSGFEDFAQELATTVELLERDGSRRQ